MTGPRLEVAHLHIASLHIYPVKGLRGLPLSRSAVEPWGLAGDRRWVVTDANGKFISQRDCPAMATIRAEPTLTGLRLSRDDGQGIDVATPEPAAQDHMVGIWRDTVPAVLATEAAHAWLSAALGRPCRLAHLADPRARPVDARFATPGDTVSFADAFPVLVVTLASLAWLNERLARTVPIGRFRPNLVLAGGEAWAEDGWQELVINGLSFRVAKPCARCVVTTLDQVTGRNPDPGEPLRTLARHRRDRWGGVIFGQNLVPARHGEIEVGMRVQIKQEGVLF